MLKNTQNLDIELNRPLNEWETLNTTKKLFILQYGNIKILEILHALYDKVALLNEETFWVWNKKLAARNYRKVWSTYV